MIIDEGAKGSALKWVVDSLSRGWDLSTRVLEAWSPGSDVRVFHDGMPEPVDFNDWDFASSQTPVRALAMAQIGRFVGFNRYLLVEDDLGLRRDPNLGPEVRFIGEHIVRVFDLGSSSDVDAAVDGLFRGASGWPANAFVVEVREPLSRFSAVGGSDWAEPVIESIVAGVVAVIVSVFDGGTYVLACSA